MRITVVGLGYVGLVTAAGLTSWDHELIGLETDPVRLEALRRGETPFFEPGLDTLISRGRDLGLLCFTDDTAEAVPNAQLVIVAVGTHDGNGGWQTQTISACLRAIVPLMADDAVLAIRSTLPPEFVPEVALLVRRIREEVGRPHIATMTNPEFTRESCAVADFLHPDRVVVGVLNDPQSHGQKALTGLYDRVDAPVLVMSAADAGMAKLGSNLFLATKISFANELASLCEAFGADVEEVVKAMSLDARIGGAFLHAGIGFGGSCLPHQVAMTIRSSRDAGVPSPLLAAVDGVNREQRVRFVTRMSQLIGGLVGRRIALLGLTFKPGTDDLRDAPALEIAGELLAKGADVVAYDPMANARSRASSFVPGLEIAATAEGALTRADAVGLVTEWAEFSQLDWSKVRGLMRGSVVLDGRNALPAKVLIENGFRYAGFGRRVPVADLPAQAVDTVDTVRRVPIRGDIRARRAPGAVAAGGVMAGGRETA